MDNKEDIEGYSMDDSSIVRMRKFYSHKKDRTLAAPKENILTTNSTIDNNVRLLILNVRSEKLVNSSSSTMGLLIALGATYRMERKESLFRP